MWQSTFVDSHGLKLHLTRTGGDKPALVLAHGFSDDGLCWTPVARALEDRFDVVMVDARGHGRSDGPEGGYGPADQAEDLAGAIVALGLERPLILGHSMGALTALTMASLHPELPGAILLEDPPAVWNATGTEDEAWLSGFRSWVVGLKRHTRDELIAQQRAETPHWGDDEVGPWADAKLRLSFNVLSRGRSLTPEQIQGLRRVVCPALLITGDPALGAIVDAAAAESLRALLPQLDVAHIAGAGHSIRRDQLAAYMAALERGLAA